MRYAVYEYAMCEYVICEYAVYDMRICEYAIYDIRICDILGELGTGAGRTGPAVTGEPLVQGTLTDIVSKL